MKITQIQYTVRADFVSRNQDNISQVMKELRSLNPKGLRYTTFLKDDGKTFIHLVVSTEEAGEVISGLKSFQKFQEELKSSDLEVKPKFSDLTLVGASLDLL
jgi:hypothetical protein